MPAWEMGCLSQLPNACGAPALASPFLPQRQGRGREGEALVYPVPWGLIPSGPLQSALALFGHLCIPFFDQVIYWVPAMCHV